MILVLLNYIDNQKQEMVNLKIGTSTNFQIKLYVK